MVNAVATVDTEEASRLFRINLIKRDNALTSFQRGPPALSESLERFICVKD